MSRIEVLALMSLESEDARTLRAQVASDAFLAERYHFTFSEPAGAAQAAAQAEVIVCGGLPEELLAAAPKLKWIAYWSAGLDGKIPPELRARPIRVTNASGVHGPNIAEHVLAWMLMFTRGMHIHLRAQWDGKWGHGSDRRTGLADELAGQTLGIVGLGRIGEALAIRARAMEMRVLGVKRDPNAHYDTRVLLDAVYGLEGLPRLLSESDHVCVALPATPETQHLFDREMLAHMKHGAFLYNVGRG